ncbi:MAG: hypothetical protein J6S67_04845 [Methanobrevibacter sp.]|nr:hypothetical protein [Methanobrevibacter sp.]
MAYVLTDEQLDAICNRSADFCGLKCIKCEAFAANMRYHNGDYENDEDDEY